MAELSTLIAIALKISILMAVVGIAAAALAKASAAYRHLIWTSALALAALMPLAVLYLPPQLAVPVLWWPEAPTVASVPVAQTGVAVAASIDWFAYLVPVLWFVWAAGATFLLLREAAAHAGLMRWRRRARPLTAPHWAATVERVARNAALPRGLTVLQSADISAPCTWGALRPTLLLPLAGENWSEAERQNALVHEFAHIHRRDYLSALVARLCRAAHWYNPLVWFAAAQVKRLQEQACDDAVLRQGGRPSEYAQLLVNIAGDARGPMRAAMGIASGSHLKGRVLAILGGPQTARVEPGVLVITGVLFALSCVMFVIATASAAPVASQREWVAASNADASRQPLIVARAGDRDEAASAPVVLTARRVSNDGDEHNSDAQESRMVVADADDADSDADSDDDDMDSAANVDNDSDVDSDQAADVNVQEEREERDGNVTVRRTVTSRIPQPPRIVMHTRRMVVHVPAVPAVNTPDIPERSIVINVPTGEMRENGELVMHRQVIRVPRIHGVHVPGQPSREIVVNVPVVRVVPAVPAVPAIPARPARPAHHAAPALPATPATPPEPPSPPEEDE